MTDLDTLRLEVREALSVLDYASKQYYLTARFEVIRAELLRLADSNATLERAASKHIFRCTELQLRAEKAESELDDLKAKYAELDELSKNTVQCLREQDDEADRNAAELAEMKQSFDLRRKANMRAIDMWRAAHPGDDLTWPDHADLCTWLMDELAALKARMCKGIVLDVDGLARGHAGLPSEWRGKRVRLVVEE